MFGGFNQGAVLAKLRQARRSMTNSRIDKLIDDWRNDVAGSPAHDELRNLCRRVAEAERRECAKVAKNRAINMSDVNSHRVCKMIAESILKRSDE